MEGLFNQEDNGAIFSECKKYRYALWRIWDKSKPKVMFIGLNPSIADGITDDPTIRRIRGFVKLWGYGGFYMLNLFTWISTDPKGIQQGINLTLASDWALLTFENMVDRIIFCWGSNKLAEWRASEVIERYPDALVLGLNKEGSPKHPLYLPSNVKPLNYHNASKSQH